MATHVVKAPLERAGVARRLVVVAVAVAVAGCAGAAPWVLPERCIGLGWVCAALLAPVGCVVAFQGVRGRADDLREFAAANFAGELAGAAFCAAIVGLLSCLR